MSRKCQEREAKSKRCQEKEMRRERAPRYCFYPSTHLPICPSIHLSISPTIRRSIYPFLHLSIHPSIYLPTYLYSIYVYVYLSYVIPSDPICPALSVSICIYPCLNVSLSICLSINQSVYFAVSSTDFPDLDIPRLSPHVTFFRWYCRKASPVGLSGPVIWNDDI